MEGELLSGAQLPLARLAREARQVVDVLPRLPDPVPRRDPPGTLAALGPEAPATETGHARQSEEPVHRLPGLADCFSTSPKAD